MSAAERLNRNADENVADVVAGRCPELGFIQDGIRYLKERAAALTVQPEGWPFEGVAW
jgi:hypothetical protein